MKLDVAVNEVTLSNVGATGEFRIRNSAKAFKILSDGLYSNKIRAIIRELSCNALDSHIAARKETLLFEVHLPTQLEPWFSVRDFGLGLDGDQVMNIYTTYFESTKTDSNEFIGALGLGSKSPFSYTENFTVTAIKNGIKRIYSAFINTHGVPSVTEMSEEVTDEGNGVEVKFSVTERYDYNTFRNEAVEVFKWFKHKPTITGYETNLSSVVYKEENIVPGVHLLGNSYTSIAVMGNIPYPLGNIPEVHKNLAGLTGLLECGLVLEFEIGELDFAASREQLSYIPLTINSIRKKLELLNANLANHLAQRANEMKNEWDRAVYLYEQGTTKLYAAAVKKYVVDTKFPLYNNDRYHGNYSFRLLSENLKKRKLEINGFRYHSGSTSRITEDREFIGYNHVYYIGIPVSKEVIIVLNDLKTGCISRARYHYANHNNGNIVTVFTLSYPDADLAVRQKEYDKLLKEIHNPPRVVKASDLQKQICTKPVATQGILTLALRTGRRSGYKESYTWNIFNGQLKDDETYYYVCVSNCTAIAQEPDANGNDVEIDVGEIKALMDECGIADIANIKIFGVRKNRYKEIKELDNWLWFEDKLKEETAKITDEHVASLVVAEMIDHYSNRVYTNKNVARLVSAKSYYNQFVTETMAIKRIKGNISELAKLCGKYGKSVQVDAVKKKLNDAKDTLMKKYPLLKYLSEPKDTDVAEYIKLVDKQEKLNG